MKPEIPTPEWVCCLETIWKVWYFGNAIAASSLSSSASFLFFLEKDKYFLAVPWKYPYSSFYAGWSMTPHLSLQKARGLRPWDAHAWPQTRCVWRRTPDGLCSHVDALKQSKWAAAATLGKYNISGLTLPPHVLTFRVGRTLSHPVSGQPSTSKMFSLSKARGPLTNGCHC